MALPLPMVAGLIGFSFINGWMTAILAMGLLTIGEILIFPANSMMVDNLAPEHLRGTYFGASQFRKIGNFLGPIIGGYFFGHISGQFMFWIISIISLSSIIFFTAGHRTFLKTTTIEAES